VAGASGSLISPRALLEDTPVVHTATLKVWERSSAGLGYLQVGYHISECSLGAPNNLRFEKQQVLL